MAVRLVCMLALMAGLAVPERPVLAQDAPAGGLTDAAVQETLAQCRVGQCAAAVQEVLAQARAGGLAGPDLDVNVVMPLTTALAEAALAEPMLAAEVAAALGVAAGQASLPPLVAVLDETAGHLAQGRPDAVDPAAISAAVLGPATGGTRKLSPGG